MKTDGRKDSNRAECETGEGRFSTTRRTGNATTGMAGAVECAETQSMQGAELAADAWDACMCVISRDDARSITNRQDTANQRCAARNVVALTTVLFVQVTTELA